MTSCNGNCCVVGHGVLKISIGVEDESFVVGHGGGLRNGAIKSDVVVVVVVIDELVLLRNDLMPSKLQL